MSVQPVISSPATLTPLRVRFCETDLMGIVHHAAYLTYFEAGRVEFLRRRGISYATWAASERLHLPVISATLEYKRAARFDEELMIETRLDLITKVRLGFGYQILRAGELVCSGTTVLCCVDDQHRPRRIPDHVRDILCGGELPVDATQQAPISVAPGHPG